MPEESDNAKGLLSRWSRRKLQKQAPTEDSQQEESQSEFSSDETTALTTEINTESELNQDEKVELPIWQQEEAAPEHKQQALAALFRQPEFKEVDHMNEYDEDFTGFDSLGGIVTQEMKRMLKLAEEKTRPVELGEVEPQPDINTTELASDETDDKQDKEDNNLA